MIKKLLSRSTIFLLSAVWPFAIMAQTLTLEECHNLARQNFPLIKQKDLLDRSSEYTLANLSKGTLPQLSLYGQATYQSEVTQISIPGINYKAPGKDQYKVYAEVIQPVTEIFTVTEQKELAKKNTEIQQQQVEVEMYKLKDRINQLYFGILLSDEQLALNQLVDKDLEAGMQRTTAAIQNGVDYKTSLDKIKAELIRNRQRAIEIKAQRKTFADMLGYFIGRSINEYTNLTRPIPEPGVTLNTRPELRIYDLKSSAIKIQEKITRQKNIPRLNLFIQGGAGQPSPLNMISNSFSPYAIGGIRASWNIVNLYTRKNDLSLLRIDGENSEIQKQVFLFNSAITTTQQNNEMVKLNQLIATDAELVAIRNSVKTTSNIQLENGVITSSDYIREVNAEDQARQQLLVHQLQLLVAQFNLQNTLGY